MNYIDVLVALLVDNYEWLFSGLGVSIAGILLYRRVSDSQSQRSGRNSINIQAKGDVSINTKDRK